MLERILESCISNTPPRYAQVTFQVEQLLVVIKGEMSRVELQTVLGLKDRKSFQERYLMSALEQGLIEMTIPESPIVLCRNIV